MAPCCLNPNPVLSLYAAVVLQFMITFIINLLSLKILLGCFSVHHFYCQKNNLLRVIGQILNPTAEFIMPTERRINEVNAEIEKKIKK